MRHQEAEIQMQIVEYLRLKCYCVFSIPNEATGGGPRAMIRMQRLKKMGLLPGAADLVVLSDQVHFIEVKTPTGRQTDTQWAFEQVVKVHGHHYHIVRSLDDVKKIL